MICTRNSNAIPYYSLLSARDGLEIYSPNRITIDLGPIHLPLTDARTTQVLSNLITAIPNSAYM